MADLEMLVVLSVLARVVLIWRSKAMPRWLTMLGAVEIVVNVIELAGQCARTGTMPLVRLRRRSGGGGLGRCGQYRHDLEALDSNGAPELSRPSLFSRPYPPCRRWRGRGLVVSGAGPGQTFHDGLPKCGTI